jgi:hypothetical protein
LFSVDFGIACALFGHNAGGDAQFSKVNGAGIGQVESQLLAIDRVDGIRFSPCFCDFDLFTF